MCAVGCADKICFRRLSHNLLCSRFIRDSWGKFSELMVIHQIRQSFPPYSMLAYIYTHTYLEVEYCRYLVDISYVYHLFKNYITIIYITSYSVYCTSLQVSNPKHITTLHISTKVDYFLYQNKLVLYFMLSIVRTGNKY